MPDTLADLEPASMALRHMVFLLNCVSRWITVRHLPSLLFQSPCSPHSTTCLMQDFALAKHKLAAGPDPSHLQPICHVLPQ